MGGQWCFKGTRLQVTSLFEHLDKGATVDEFLEWFPAVRCEQAHAVLDFARSTLNEPAAVRILFDANTPAPLARFPRGSRDADG